MFLWSSGKDYLTWKKNEKNSSSQHSSVLDKKRKENQTNRKYIWQIELELLLLGKGKLLFNKVKLTVILQLSKAI
jgi:hypothetical protein